MSRYIRRHLSNSHTVASVLGESLTVDGRTYPITDAISPRVSRSGRVAYKTHETGAAMVLERDGSMWVPSTVTAGHAPLAWDVEDLLIQRDNSGALLRVSPDGSAVTQTIGRYASEGIARVLPDGTVVLGNERTGIKRGRMCWNWDEDEYGNLVCLSDAGSPTVGAVAFWEAVGQSWLMWVPSAHVQEAPHVSGGRVAISGWDTPEPGAVPWAPLAEAVVPLPAWPAPLPILIGCLSHTPAFSDPGTIGNVGTGKQVLIEGYRQSDGAAWCPDLLKPLQRLIYVDWRESHAKATMLANAKADQDAYGGTLVFYFDAQVAYLPADLEQLRQAKQEGRAVAIGLQCYPGPATRDRVRDEIATYGPEFPVVLFTSAYVREWSKTDARIAMRDAAHLAHSPHVRALILTKRPPYVQAIQDDIAECCALSQGADVDVLFPKWVRPVPIRAEPTPIVVARPPAPRQRTWRDFWRTLRRRVGF